MNVVKGEMSLLICKLVNLEFLIFQLLRERFHRFYICFGSGMIRRCRLSPTYPIVRNLTTKSESYMYVRKFKVRQNACMNEELVARQKNKAIEDVILYLKANLCVSPATVE